MVKALAALLPLGALGVSVALAAAPGQPAAPAQQDDAAERGVADRLQAIREAISEITAEQTDLEPGDPNIGKVQWLNFGGSWLAQRRLEQLAQWLAQRWLGQRRLAQRRLEQLA